MIKTKNIPSPILITGCARSGTSVVAALINMCGAFGGDMRGANPNNRKGMFENTKIVQGIVKPYLRGINMDHLGQYPLPDIQDLPIIPDLKLRMEQVMMEEGYEEGPWMYKGAKMCLIWPIFNYSFPNAKWVIVRRKTGDIVQSCLKTGFMRAFRNVNNQNAVGVESEEEGWFWWVHQHQKRWVEMIEAGLNCKTVWPERMVNGDYEQMKETIEWLGLDWNLDCENFVDKKFWKSKNKYNGTNNNS